MTIDFLFKSKKDWYNYAENLKNIPSNKKDWWSLSKTSPQQQQYMLGYREDNNLIGSGKIHYISDKDLEERGLENVMKKNRKIMEIVDVQVDPSYRGQGYCKQIIEDCTQLGGYLNKSLYLVAEGWNTAALKCYLANGFKYFEPSEKLVEFYKKRWDFLKDPKFMIHH